jgi:predicted aldo/keto reductase-like oxidoreductase
MIYCTLGNTGLTASRLGFGTMRLPIGSLNPDFEEAVCLIQYAINKGINFFDVGTFYCHGHCENVYGIATSNMSSEKLLVCGKNITHLSNNLNWLAQLKNSLLLFKRKSFDLYFLHYLNFENWQSYFFEKKVIDQIKQAKDSGLIRHLGFSSHDTPANVSKLIDTKMFEAVILSYNLLRREYEETLKYAHQQGLGVIIMNPLAGGALAEMNIIDHESRKDKNLAKVAQLALNYVLSQPFAHIVLSGMESKDIVDENIRTIHRNRLNSQEIDSLTESISREIAKVFVPCTSCNYCMPCVQGIDIPGIIKIWNHYSILRGKKMFAREYAMLPISAECCIQCKACVEKCPNQIDVPDIMLKASQLFYC